MTSLSRQTGNRPSHGTAMTEMKYALGVAAGRPDADGHEQAWTQLKQCKVLCPGSLGTPSRDSAQQARASAPRPPQEWTCGFRFITPPPTVAAASVGVRASRIKPARLHATAAAEYSLLPRRFKQRMPQPFLLHPTSLPAFSTFAPPLPPCPPAIGDVIEYGVLRHPDVFPPPLLYTFLPGICRASSRFAALLLYPAVSLSIFAALCGRVGMCVGASGGRSP